MSTLKYALITGSTKGIGRQIAAELLQEGCYVILNYAHGDEAAQTTFRDLSRISATLAVVKADLSTLTGLEELLQGVRKITPVVDYLILNAAATIRIPFQEITPADWSRVFDTNLTIPFFLIQKLSPAIREDGRIIFIGALMGMVPHAISLPYGVSKAPLGILARYLVREFAPRGITVNVVAPGFVETPWQQDKEPHHRQRIEAKIALHRFANPAEVAGVCRLLITNAYITGQVIIVDGGYDC